MQLPSLRGWDMDNERIRALERIAEGPSSLANLQQENEIGEKIIPHPRVHISREITSTSTCGTKKKDSL
jgi:hypothetical protein